MTNKPIHALFIKPVLLFILLFFTLLLMGVDCNKYPYNCHCKITAGYVIAKERCHVADSLNYYLINLTKYANTPQYGDTLIVNGKTYTNVVKTKDLDSVFRQIGDSVSIQFQTITANKVVTIGCEVSSPVTYHAKEVFVQSQGYVGP